MFDDRIKEKARELEAIYDVIQEPILLINEKFKIQRVNQATVLFTKNSKFSDLLGKECHEILYGRKEICPYCPMVTKRNISSDSSKGPASREIFFVQNGKKQVLYLEFYPYPKEGKVWLVEKISDITDAKDKEEETLRMRNLASLGILVSGIAHELNNPLTGISLTIQNLETSIGNATPELVTKKLQMMKNDVSRAAMIVSDIISFAKNDRIKFTLGDLSETIQRAKDTVCRLFPHLSKSIQWEIDLEDDLQFHFHPGKIERLFLNLFRNSLQAFDYKSGEIKVQVQKRKSSILILVEDNAGGIPDNIIKKIFDPFFTQNKSNSGTGLGLSICHSIIKEHNGSITVRSDGGKTKFSMVLPESK